MMGSQIALRLAHKGHKVTVFNRDKSKINIIPYNTYPGSKYNSPSDRRIKWFQEELNLRGFVCTVRISKGKDILAACGQLAEKA